jgi:hypothetical protein
MVMQTAIFQERKHFRPAFLVLILPFVILFQGCEKAETLKDEAASGRPPRNQLPPLPPPAFYFTNCFSPFVQGSFIKGVPTTARITLNYINSPGGPHTGFTSTTLNGITLRAPAGILNPGSGSIVYTASGTPVTAGVIGIWVSIGTSSVCPLNVTVLNPPPSGPTVNPAAAVGSVGVINFTYKGQPVAYQTVRAADGKIWLQQNLGSSRVAINQVDQPSYGDYFQWGRWDDGHQAFNSATITGGPSLQNPSHISSGNPKFIKGTTTSTKWWSTGLASNTWSGTVATSTKGKDPCAALGSGWRLPTSAEWENVSILEDLFGTIAAFDSNLKLPAAGYRLSYSGMLFQNGDNGHYWTSNAANNGYARVFFYDDNTYNAETAITQRAEGFPCRCVKN